MRVKKRVKRGVKKGISAPSEATLGAVSNPEGEAWKMKP
jgi:hypothetical protein